MFATEAVKDVVSTTAQNYKLETQLFPSAKISRPSKHRILVTGACGLFGHHFIEHILTHTNWDVIAMVRMGKVGNLMRLMEPEITSDAWASGRLRTVWHDFASPIPPHVANAIGPVEFIVHSGAETHVDRSITDPGAFVTANVIGTFNMLEYAKTIPELVWFNYFSTDEVYGPAPVGVEHAEDAPINATNPYAASKAGAEALVNSYGNSYNLPVFITNTMNLIGERQDPEKFLPLIMNKILDDEELLIHANADRTKAGSRFYLHCRNAADALLFLLANAKQRERYNIVGEVETDNLDLAQQIFRLMTEGPYNPFPPGTLTPLKLRYRMVDFHSSRPGHDLRYALDGSKLKRMGFTYPLTFETSLAQTVNWLMRRPEWLGRN
jgi:dTDP-glucose 4,6-dehydratase